MSLTRPDYSTTSPPTPFFLGVNIPWKAFGNDVGTNQWNVRGVRESRPEREVRDQEGAAKVPQDLLRGDGGV